ncbi:MAG: SAM-dependent DNA methyltransferase [Bacteroidetes bacterium]|nr:MAG: SAM-dependent DNA methyltransferase [Bacteroidota bacterium]
MRIDRQLQGTLNTLLTECIKERGLQKRIAPYPEQEASRADILLKTVSGSHIFHIELKDPTAPDGRNVYNKALQEREKARAEKLQTRYFGMCNFLNVTLLDTQDLTAESPMLGDAGFTLEEIKLMQADYVAFIQKETYLKKLKEIANYYLDRAIELLDSLRIKSLPIDEIFIYRIEKLIESYLKDISVQVEKLYFDNTNFKNRVQKYTQDQGWNIPTSYDEFENITFIALLVLVSKLVFYKNYYDKKSYSILAPLQIPEDLTTASALKEKIWDFFETFKTASGNFEILIGTANDVIFEIPFVADDIVLIIREILDSIQVYDFSIAPYDIIGRIFENLIRPNERHKLGQYFTPPDVIDFMLAFAIQDGNEKVFDPSCGSGTF